MIQRVLQDYSIGDGQSVVEPDVAIYAPSVERSLRTIARHNLLHFECTSTDDRVVIRIEVSRLWAIWLKETFTHAARTWSGRQPPLRLTPPEQIETSSK